MRAPAWTAVPLVALASFIERGDAASHPPEPPPPLRRSESGHAASLAHAELRRESLSSASLKRDVSVSVQLPPGYARPEARFPLVLALHGLFESDAFWQRRGLDQLLDELWRAKALPEFVLITPDGGNSFFVNAPQGAYEDLVTRDVVAWAEARYRLQAGRDRRALLGISMGGYAALRIGLGQPQAFGRVATHSAMLLLEPPTREKGAGRWHMAAFEAVFGSPIDTGLWARNDPLALALRAEAGSAPALSIDCGAEDRYGLAAGHRELHERLLKRGLRHEFALPPGDHGYEYVRGVLRGSLAFLTRGW